MSVIGQFSAVSLQRSGVVHVVTTGLDTICSCRLSPHAVSTNCLKLDFYNFGVRADIVTRKSAILQVFLISQNLNPAQAVKLFLSIKLSEFIHTVICKSSRLCLRKPFFWVCQRNTFVKIFNVSLAIEYLDLVMFDAAVFQTCRCFHNTCRNSGFWSSTFNRRSMMLKLLDLVKIIIEARTFWSFYIFIHLWSS